MPSLGDLFVTVGAKIDGFKSAMGEVKQSVNTVGMDVNKLRTIAGVGLGAVGFAALAAAKNFNDASVLISNSTGATGARLKQLEGSFAKVYAQVDESSTQVAEALSLLSTRTGATGTVLESMTVKLLDLAKVQREDVATLTPLVTRAFGDWTIASEDQTRAMDYLGIASQQTGVKVARLAEQVIASGAPLRELGYNFESATALVAKFDKEGVNTELVLGGMKAALQKFAKEGVQDTARAWKDLIDGVKAGTVSFKQLVEIVGAKRGVDLFKAIQEGRFEIDSMADSFKELAREGIHTTDTITEKFKKVQHQLESVVGANKELIIGIGAIVPTVVAVSRELAGAIGGWAVLFKGAGIAAGIAFAAAFAEVLAQKYPAVATAFNFARLGGLPFGKPPSATPRAPGSAGAASGTSGSIPGPPPSRGGGGGAGGGAAGSAFQPFGPEQSGFATPYWIEQVHRSIAAHQKLIDVMVTLGETGSLAAYKMGRAWRLESTPALNELQLELMSTLPVIADIAEVDFSQTRKGILETEDAMQALGLTSTRALRAIYDGALASARQIARLRDEGKATDADLSAAMGKVAEAHRDLSQRVNDWEGSTKKAKQTGIDFGRQVSLAFNDLSRSLTDVLFGQKKLADAFKDVGKTIVRVIMEEIIGIGIKELMGALSGLLKHLGSVGKSIGGILGGTGTPAPTAGGVASGAGGVASAAGGAASAAGSGLTGIIGAAGAAVSAVSSVIGNFQFAGMNKSLDVIVNHTLRTFNEIFQMRKDHWDQFNGMYQRVGEIWNTLKDTRTGAVTIDLRGSTFGGGTSQAQINAMMQQAFREAYATLGG